MGIPRGSARLLLDEAKRRPFSGSVIQLGRSTLYFGRDELEGWAREQGVRLAAGIPTRPSHDPRLARQGCIDDRTFFSLLGCERVESCDISDWEGADHVFDLNRPVPEALHGRFDVVLDPGSSLQIFDQPQLLRNLHALTAPGGRVIHVAVPSNNHVDLGFYMFSPTFYDDFYRANGWRIDTHLLCEYFPYWHRGRLYSAPWKIYRYEPGCLDHLSFGRFGGKQAAIFLVATKLEAATGDVVPQLGQFVRSWQHFEEQRADPTAAAGELPGETSGLARLAERLFDRLPWLSRLYLPLKRLKERGRRRLLPPKMPPLVARY